MIGCQSDAECVAKDGAGAKCIDGQCVKPADQCTDGTQCPPGDQCVQGVCTPSCDGTHPCPPGYSCDTMKGVCTGNPSPCGTGMACSSPEVCVEGHCVNPCGPGNACPSGLVCVNGGCIPDQKPVFICAVDGQPGDGTMGKCATGSICLHHACYIACDYDAGMTACKQTDRFNICKLVTTSSGTYSVCGSSSNLGSECDPTQGKNCTSPAICIDGYCR
jgi:hypothetical protein